MAGKEGFSSTPSVAGKDVKFIMPKMAMPSSKESGSPAFSGMSLFWQAMVVIALGLSLVSMGIAAYSMLSLASFKGEASAIANDLRLIANKQQINISTPLTTEVKLRKTIPMSNLIPPGYAIPVQTEIRLRKRVNAIPVTGVPIIFDMDETVPVKFSLALNQSTIGSASITVDERMPVEENATITIRIIDAYPQEFKNLIDRLERMGS